MTEIKKRRPLLLPLACLAALLALPGCSSIPLLFEPEPNDPNDGYEGSLAQAGVNTELDWGPQQNLLLSQYELLKRTHNQLEQRLEAALSENQNLKTQLNDEQKALQTKTSTLAQIEAQLVLKQQKLSEQEATILTLRIDKAKAEQAALLAKIDVLRATMEEINPSNAEAAMPPANR